MLSDCICDNMSDEDIYSWQRYVPLLLNAYLEYSAAYSQLPSQLATHVTIKEGLWTVEMSSTEIVPQILPIASYKNWSYYPCSMHISKVIFMHSASNILVVNSVIIIPQNWVTLVWTPPYVVNNEFCLFAWLLTYLIHHPLYGWKPFKCKPTLHQTHEWTIIKC